MTKKTLPHIEDYIEALAGFVKIQGTVTNFSLARYDVQIVASFADQTTQGIGYTDKQALLAHKLVVKYKKQFLKYDIDIGMHERNGHYRMPVRIVDRTKSVKLVNGKLQIRFPYDSKLIDHLKESGKNIHGEMKFDKETKVWLMAVTEPRLLWAKDFIDKYQFDVDPSVIDLIKEIDIEKQNPPFEFKLERVDGSLKILNGEQSLIDYIETNLGGFCDENLVKLIDYSSVLGYTVDNDLIELLKHLNENQIRLLTNRQSHIPLSDSGIKDVIDYAAITNRWPIYVFETVDVSQGKIIEFLKNSFTADELLEVGTRQRSFDVTGKKCIYVTNWQYSWSNKKIPILITMMSAMIGSKKQHMLQQADKVVYSTDILLK